MAREKLEPLDFVKDLRIFLGKLEDRDWLKEQREPGIMGTRHNMTRKKVYLAKILRSCWVGNY